MRLTLVSAVTSVSSRVSVMLKRGFGRRVTAVLAFCGVLLLYRLSCRTRTHSGSQRPAVEDAFEAFLQRHEQQYVLYASNLTKRISQLKKELRRSAVELPADRDESRRAELREFLLKQLRRSGEPLRDEFALLPFESFSLHSVCQLETGLSRLPVENPLRLDRKSELNGALEAALHLLNRPEPGDSRSRRIYSPKHFYEGIFRTERDRGTLYDLAFRENSVPDFRRLVFFRPFAPLMKVKQELMDASQILINIIVPLAETTDAFRRFMQHFSEVCIRQDGRTHLTVVFFGSEKMDEVKAILDGVSRRMRYRNVTLVRLNEGFSRARGLDAGARAWKQSNVLLFFCDVNVHFTADFLNSCRMNAQPGKKVFYPVMFSQYNPELIYGQHVPPAQDQMVIRKDFGFWKDDDFGMTCQYRSDFINAGGFVGFVRGSASEDLRLYRKFLHSSLMVIRAPSRGLFGSYRQTVCQDGWSTEMFSRCVQTKALNEASHARLGQMIFQQQIDRHLHKYRDRRP